MEIVRSRSFFLSLAFVLCCLLQSPALASKKSYVVYLGEHSHGSQTDASEMVTQSHYDLLASVLGDREKARDAIFYSYTKHINGFAANLEDDEAAKIARLPGVVSVFPNRGHKLHTTRSWQFLGLERNGVVPMGSPWSKARFGEDTIIANLDTGVWPESQSFRDDGMGPIPSRWRGVCQNGADKKFSCNRKLIGARYFNKGYEAAIGRLNSTCMTPRDLEGHGTHTLSTAGGAFVPGANVFGYGNGTAKGGSPRARVAAYKVCYPPVNGGECFDADILAGFDAAIHDGVDVLSVSLGGGAADYFQDVIAIGSFHAIKNGIVVVCSAGNSGPQAGTVTNVAPWILTVGASTMDREFPSYIVFNHMKLLGQSLSATRLPGKDFYPMINSADAKANNISKSDAQLCFLGSLDPKKVKGKIVVCLRGVNARVEKGEAVSLAGGAGMVLANDFSYGNEIIADAHVLPATHITYSDGLILFSYLNSTKSPSGYITKPKTELDTKPAPFMAAFSSQGPNTVNPEILKPDIAAPGVSVIAAYTMAESPTELSFDHRRIPFNSESGTSMSCPHISGVAGLLKTLHPAWSPAAIKSAIMTSGKYIRQTLINVCIETNRQKHRQNVVPYSAARTWDNKKEPILNSSFVKATPFNYGAGQVWPNRAMDPGLVYDLATVDYLNFLCALGYNSTEIMMINGVARRCPSERVKLQDLNYPSITIHDLSKSITVRRRVKNVGSPGTYTAHVKPPRGIRVTVKPSNLTFDSVGEEKVFKVTFEVKDGKEAKDYVFGMLRWSDGKHFVRSPLVVKTKGRK